MPFRKLDLQFVDTDIANIIDPLLVFNYSATGNNTSDSGVIIERGDLTNVGIIWDESTDTFALINTSEDGSTTGNVTISSYANLRADTITATLSGNVTGNITGDVTGDLTGNVTSTGTSSFSSIDVNGGAIDGTAIGASSASTGAFSSLTTSGNATIGGNLTVNGTTKTVNSTVVEVADPVMMLGGTSSPSTDDNKDRGIGFRWHDGSSAKIGYFGFDDSTGKFTFVPDGNITNDVASGDKGILDVGGLEVDSSGRIQLGGIASGSYHEMEMYATGSQNLIVAYDGEIGMGRQSGGAFKLKMLQPSGAGGTSIELNSNTTGGHQDINAAQTAIPFSLQHGGVDKITIDGLDTSMPSGQVLSIGDLQLYQSSSYYVNVIQARQSGGNGPHLYFCPTSSGNFNVKSGSWMTGENMIIAKSNAEVELYYNNSLKFETTDEGIWAKDEFTLESTDSGNSAGPILNLKRDSSSPANADYLGQIKFKGENSTGGEVNYAKITGKILDVTNGSEDGILEFAFIKGGSQNISARFRSDSLQLLNGTNLHIGDSGDITFEGSTDNAYETTLTVVDPTADRTLSLPNQTGTLAITTDIPGSSSDVQFDSFGVGTAASGTTGEIRATNDVTAYYSSDERLKENVVEIDNALEKVKQIRGVRYDWTDEHIKSKGGPDNYFMRKTDVGVIAQEIEAVLPEIVAERDDGIKAVRYERLTALLIEAVKELSARVDELEKKQ